MLMSDHVFVAVVNGAVSNQSYYIHVPPLIWFADATSKFKEEECGADNMRQEANLKKTHLRAPTKQGSALASVGYCTSMISSPSSASA
jgi:hypothetical protein